MPIVVNTQNNAQQSSKLKTILSAPVRWLIIGIIAALFIIFILLTLAFILVVMALSKLYCFAGGKIPVRLAQAAEELDERAHAIINTPQTTHDTDVNKEVDVNVQALRKEYGEPDVGDECIKKITDFINESKYKENEEQDPNEYKFTEDEVNHALKCLERIKTSTEKRVTNKLTLKQILNLVWKACNDEGINGCILQRQHQLVKHLIDAETEYIGKYESCFGGTFNYIVTSLYMFEEFTFLKKQGKLEAKHGFKHALQNTVVNQFNKLNNADKKKVAEFAEASSEPSTDFFLSCVESLRYNHSRAILGGKECDRLTGLYFSNLQYIEEVAQFTR